MRFAGREVIFFIAAVVAGLSCGCLSADNGKSDRPNLYAKKNLVAWCIVPFDGKKRGPVPQSGDQRSHKK